jgi:hypothetical protein
VTRLTIRGAIALAALAPAIIAADWSNSGGNAQRNGQTTEIGPNAQDLLWSGGAPSIIAWQPATEGKRVFMVRQTGFPPGGEPNGSPLFAYDLDTGAQLWRADIPFNSGDWTTWLAGVKNGRVYASRSGNGASVAAKMYCLDAASGGVLWASAETTRGGMYDGVVFAPDGDPIVADFYEITRLNAEDGATVWRKPRVGSVSGTCGAALFGEAIYVVDASPGGNRVERYDLATGNFQYESELMPGFTIQNTPMVGPDGTIYVNRTQNNVNVDFFYALTDTGSAITIKWSIPSRWTTSSEFAVGPDGSVYMLKPGNLLARLDPSNGATLNEYGPIPTDPGPNVTPRMAVDAAGKLYFSNGCFQNGWLFSFDADLTLRWSEPLPNSNIGTPSIGQDGTLIIAGTGTNVKAYRSPGGPACTGDLDGDGQRNQSDLGILLAAFGACPGDPNYNPAAGELAGDPCVTQADLGVLLSVFGVPCD